MNRKKALTNSFIVSDFTSYFIQVPFAQSTSQVTTGQGVEAKATIFCPRAVLEVAESPRGPCP